MLPERDAILKALESVIDPELHKPVTEQIGRAHV
jgi:hypothetical protein